MSETYKAVVFEAAGQPFAIKSFPIPQPRNGEAVVKILATLLSPNSRDVYAANSGWGSLETPTIPSAPSVARIHSVGPDSTTLKAGQLVFTDFWTQSRDNPDDSILAGYMSRHKTLEAAWNQGTFAEYAVVPLERIWALNESLLVDKMKYTPADLSYLECINIALAGLMRINVLPGDSVIVAPATGTFGGATVPAALALGARVIACGRNAETLKHMAQVYGESGRFTSVTLSGDADTDTAAIKTAAGGKGADKYIDFVPPSAVGTSHIRACLSALRPRGSAGFLGAIFAQVDIPYALILTNQLTIRGSFMFDREHVEQSIKLLEAGHLALGDRKNSGVKMHGFKLENVEDAIDAAAKYRGWGNMVFLEP